MTYEVIIKDDFFFENNFDL